MEVFSIEVVSVVVDGRAVLHYRAMVWIVAGNGRMLTEQTGELSLLL